MPGQARPLVSAWAPTTFTAERVKALVQAACPREKLVEDAGRLAAAMNSAAHELLLSLLAHEKASDTQAWAERIAEACGALRSACGNPPSRAALRLGVPPAGL